MSCASRLTFLIALIFVLDVFLASAGVPPFISYQGRLTDNTSTPVDGPQLIRFNIYGSESGNDSIWSSGFQLVQVNNGLFEYQLGSIVSLPDDLFSSGVNRYLGITIGVDSEIIPRTRITSAAYSYQALRSDSSAFAIDIADACVTTDKIDNYAVTDTKIADNSVTTAHIQDHTIMSDDIGNGEITGDNIKDGTIILEDIGQNGAVDGNVIKWNNILAQWETAPDDIGNAGDITAVYTIGGLEGGGDTGDLTISIANNGVMENNVSDAAITTPKLANNAVTSDKIINNAVTADKIAVGAVGNSELANDAVTSEIIQNGSITDNDVNIAAGINRGKIGGTAAVTDIYQNFFYNSNYFNGNNYLRRYTYFNDDAFPGAYVQFYDSTIKIDKTGIRIGDAEAPSSSYLVDIERDMNTSSGRHGINLAISNSGIGTLIGAYSKVVHNTVSAGGPAYAIMGLTETDGSSRYGVYASVDTRTPLLGSGLSYGVYGSAAGGNNNYGVYGYAGTATGKYGVYGSCGSSYGNYGGYFWGNLHATGSNTKGGGGFKIDHPLDPENKYLFHSDVQSPDMMNVYNGNVILDANGEAIIELPYYFEALNADFRYQLTCIGDFAPVYVSERISDNRFSIAGGLPFMEVSWQVTGIRIDAYSRVNSIQVEMEKPDNEKGLYLHPEAFGYGVEQSINYEQNKDIIEKTDKDN